jgi:predicted acylesterase/phospholipase RssA
MFLALLLLLAPVQQAETPRQFALTISGGVSLGAYEGGLTWTLVNYLRSSGADKLGSLNLAGVTGASAGSINALLAAAFWCQHPDEKGDSSLDDNLFRETWLPVGLDQLLPDGNEGFTRADVLFRAAPLEETLARLQPKLFGSAARKFRPGCSVPLGITVTRTRAERESAGLGGGAQRFVIPWRFEVDAEGQAHILRDDIREDRDSAASQLFLAESRSGLDAGETGSALDAEQASNALLASGAFPFAFRPRILCDCALECPSEEVALGGSCPGPGAAQTLTALSCNAIPPLGKRTLCKRAYVDGGIFDNAPLGLAIDLVEERAPRTPLQPIVYLVVDPDLRRLAPRTPKKGESSSSLALDPLELFSNLIGSARTESLSRAANSARWQLDTRSLLDRASVLFGDFARLEYEMVHVAGGEPQAMLQVPVDLLRAPKRSRLAKLLFDCSREPALEHACAEQLRSAKLGKNDPGFTPQPRELAAFVKRVRTRLDAASIRAAAPPPAMLEGRLALVSELLDGVLLLAADFRFLQGEIQRAQRALPVAELEQVRSDLLAVISKSSLVAQATRVLLSSLAATVVLEEGPKDAEALARRLLASREASLEATLPDELAQTPGRLRELLLTSKKLDALAGRADELGRAASDIAGGRYAERTLIFSRRFTPLASSALVDFSGFLDGKLRELDFNLGAYDMAMQIADFRCRSRDPYSEDRPAPPVRLDAPWELDQRAEDTQRCIGEELRAVTSALGIDRAKHALTIFARSARVQLAVALGSDAKAAALFREASWSWLAEAAKSHPRDDLEVALEVLMSKRVPCDAGEAEALCLADPEFRDLIVGLRAAGFAPQDNSLRVAFEDPDRWMIAFSRRLVDRGLASADSGAVKGSEVVLFGMRAGELLLRREEQQTWPHFALDGSSVPGGPIRPDRSPAAAELAHVVPYRLGVEVAGGGLTFSWLEPSLHFGPAFSLQSKLDLIDLHGWRGSSTVGLLPTLALFGTALSVGPRWTIPWTQAPSAPGVEARHRHGRAFAEQGRTRVLSHALGERPERPRLLAFSLVEVRIFTA